MHNFAGASEIVSVYHQLSAEYPGEAKYIAYLRARFPRMKLVIVPGIPDLNERCQGMMQSPLVINYVINNCEYDEFSMSRFNEEMRVKYGCEYVCSGISCYEGMGRALYLRRVGLCDEKKKMIYPIGLMKQDQVLDLLKRTGVKLHPSYKLSPESHDTASYFRMRAAFVAKPEYRREVLKHHPMVALDEYRYEVLFGGKAKKRT